MTENKNTKRWPKIGVVFFGIPRASQLTFDSIQKNILNPAYSSGEVFVRYHFYKQTRIDNPRTGEKGFFCPLNYKPFEVFDGMLAHPDVIDKEYDIDWIFGYGDAWKDGFKSAKNLLMQLYSISTVTKLILQDQPDVVVFARPDIVYHDSIGPSLEKAIDQRHLSVARIPNWQWSKGYNDRFSICTHEAIKWYGFRANCIQEYLAIKGGPLHSEALLKYALDRSLCNVRLLSVRGSRARIDGSIVEEGFKKLRGSRLLKYQLKELCKIVILSF